MLLAALAGLGEAKGDGWQQLVELLLAFVLSSLIGLERSFRRRDAGLRTYALVGVGAALFLLVGKYGFENVTLPNRVELNPSRVAAQIVTGVGFLGSALIFRRQDAVRGLTTAATVWVTAGVGMACAAGLPILAVAVVVLHFVVVFVYTPLRRRLGLAWGPTELSICYQDGQGILRKVLAICTRSGFTVGEVDARHVSSEDRDEGRRYVNVVLQVHGRGSVPDLAAALEEMDGVTDVRSADAITDP